MINFKQLIESIAFDQASRAGLQYHGFGRYGTKDGKVTHVSKMGKLVPIHKVPEMRTLHNDELKHLEHTEDEVFTHGVHGVTNAMDQFKALQHDDNRTTISQKIDGSPSFVMGKHPQTGKFFVASKSAFNKDPKINYTEDDIDRNHGHAPGLASKLKQLLKHGHKLGVDGVVQGDFLYDHEDKKDEGNKYSFKPNTIRYSIGKDTPEGKAVGDSKIGVALHTRYEGDKAVLDPNIEYKHHKDVYVMPVAVNKDKMKFDKDMIKKKVSDMGSTTKSITKEGWDAVTHSSIFPHVKTYINSEVRKGNQNYNVDGLKKHIFDKHQKEIDSVKTEKSKATKTAKRNDLLSHVENNRQHFENAFKLQGHINDVKHHIIDKLDHGQTFHHSYDNGDEAKPEGYVMIGHHGPLKLVDRANFSRANFEMSKNR